MNKQELIDAVAAGASIGKSEAGNAIQAVLNVSMATVKRGEAVQLIGFGAFSRGAARGTKRSQPDDGGRKSPSLQPKR